MRTIPLVIAAMVLFFVLERLFPLRRQSRPLIPRLVVNAVLSILTYATAAFVVRPSSLWAMGFSESASFGLLHWLTLPSVFNFALGFVLLDLTFYYWHRANHVVPFLWRFHNVHHFDPDLDVSTGFRFHFGEVALSSLFRVAQAMSLGISLRTFVAYELVFQIETYFHHSNIRFPLPIERVLNFFIVTPRMHGIHHSQYHQETNSNYAVIFSLWDRLHRTFCWNVPQSEIRIGVPGYALKENNQVGSALLTPFRQQKDYWLGHEKRPGSPRLDEKMSADAENRRH